MSKQKQPKPKQRCPNCGKAMKQQFIGLKHCKCGTSWQRGVGHFERTSDMVFALERKVTKKGKNSVKTKQVPVIRHKSQSTPTPTSGAICRICKGDMLKVDGCKPSKLVCDGTQYNRIRVGDANDFFEDGGLDTRCGDCGAKYGHYHHQGCDCERCPVCEGQLLSCGCDVKTVY